MINLGKDFRLFAKDKGVSMSVFDDYANKGVRNSLTPMIMEESPKNFGVFDIYSKMLSDRIIFFGHEFNTDTCNVVAAELLYLDSISNNDINIYVNSPGGEVSNGLMCLATMDYVQSDVATTCLGTAASMGAVLLSNGTKGKRSILPYGRVMIHDIAGGYRGKFTDVDIDYKNMKSYRDDLYSILAKNTGKSIEEITQFCDRDFWMKDQEAVDFGIVDQIITRK